MLCHIELKENYFSILCLKMNEVSEFTCRKLNMTLAFLFFCLCHLELRGHSGHARENKDSPAAQRCNPKRKKERTKTLPE